MRQISFEEFKKLDIRVGKVLSAEAVLGSDKLLKLEIDIGGPSTRPPQYYGGRASSGQGRRQVIAGIAGVYNPKEIIGKNFIVLANLEPKEIFGLESQGMILCADSDGEPIYLTPLKEVPPGTKVR